jgi:hypothetical protein
MTFMAHGRMKAIQVGGGGPVIIGRGVTTPAQPEDVLDPKKKTGSVKSVLSVSHPAAEAGQEVIERVRDAIREFKQTGSETSIRTLGFLAQHYPEIALRVPELFDFLNWLAAKHNHGAVARILGDAARGRRRESPFYLVAFVELVCSRNEWSVAKAARWIEEKMGARFHKSAASIQNDYSRYRDYYRVWRSPFVPGGDLTPTAWRRRKT